MLSNQFSELLVARGSREPQRHRPRASGKRATLERSMHGLRHTAVWLLKDAGVSDAIAMPCRTGECGY